ncbi:DUF3558 domain-containing protein [Streptomyces hoynatensis]|uniref:DUF3558 domain-containing protein n=1 Tax=Streptomyces hoynatensis TaxID=1141874 RepID=UPI00131A0D4E|nr:DUF3558 domain-containing protein [Streptomyces hoynatensis]
MQGTAAVARAVAAMLTTVAMCGLAACSSDLVGADDATGGGPPGSSADTGEPQPGRYSVLPEPCGTVAADTLAEILPGGTPEEYAGEPRVTYDTGRRVGCDWRTADATGSRQLAVDYERVVSYDPAVSDDDQAELDFEQRAAEAGVTLGETEGGTGGAATAGSSGSASSSAGASGSSGSAGSAGSAGSLGGTSAPRAIDGIGNAAFLDDRPGGTGLGTSRDVTLVFRTANVIVTVNYTVSAPSGAAAGTSADALDSTLLQQRAQTVARQLAGDLDG